MRFRKIRFFRSKCSWFSFSARDFVVCDSLAFDKEKNWLNFFFKMADFEVQISCYWTQIGMFPFNEKFLLMRKYFNYITQSVGFNKKSCSIETPKVDSETKTYTAFIRRCFKNKFIRHTQNAYLNACELRINWTRIYVWNHEVHQLFTLIVLQNCHISDLGKSLDEFEVQIWFIFLIAHKQRKKPLESKHKMFPRNVPRKRKI